MASVVEDELNDPRGMSYCLQPRQTILNSERVNKKHKSDNSCNSNTCSNNSTTMITCSDDNTH